MNFETRGTDIISCSSLPRLAQCAGSFLLSKGCPDTKSEDATAGDIVHWLVSFFAVGGERAQADKYQVTHPALWDQAMAMWKHALRAATDFFGASSVLTWMSEERVWLLDGDLTPILSGQYDLLCTSGGGPNEARFVIFDLKSGFLAGEVPEAQCNWQVKGMSHILKDKYGPGAEIYGSIVREWAAEEPKAIYSSEIPPLLEKVYSATDAGDAGLKTGPHCRYCPANLNGKCPIKKDQLAMVLKTEFALDMVDMADEALVKILKAKKPAETVIDAAETEVRRRRAAGINVTGVVFEPGSVRRSVKDLDGLVQAVGIPVPTKLDAKLSDIEGAWLKAKGMKGKDGKDAFSRTFKDFLEFKPDKESISC